jgi:hypothetical protein
MDPKHLQNKMIFEKRKQQTNFVSDDMVASQLGQLAQTSMFKLTKGEVFDKVDTSNTQAAGEKVIWDGNV